MSLLQTEMDGAQQMPKKRPCLCSTCNGKTRDSRTVMKHSVYIPNTSVYESLGIVDEEDKDHGYGEYQNGIGDARDGEAERNDNDFDREEDSDNAKIIMEVETKIKMMVTRNWMMKTYKKTRTMLEGVQ